MAIIKFEATRLVTKNKKGILKPDASGYYTTVIGGLNAINSSGHWYSDAARYIFTGEDNNNILQRRIKAGNLCGEAGHPKPTPGMSNDDFKYRLLTIDEKCVSHHIRRIYLDDSFGKNNPEYGNDKMIGIIAEVKPDGPYGPALQSAFDNPDRNVCFSIRGFTDDAIKNGRRVRTLFEVVSFDWVIEPGLPASTKWDSPACEAASLETIDAIDYSPADFEKLITSNKGNALESDSVTLAKSIMRKYEQTNISHIKPKNLNINRW